MNKIVIVVLLLVLIGGGVFFISQEQNPSSTQQSATQLAVKEEMPEKAEGTVSTTGYTGSKLAGTTTPYLEFTNADYDKARSEGKIIVLNFYANWCPICRAELSEVKAAFDSLTQENVVGFQVNFKDDQTDTDESALAKEFSVPYQHTKVILKDGNAVFKETAQWTKQDFIDAIIKASL